MERWIWMDSTCNNCLYDQRYDTNVLANEHSKTATSPLCMSSLNSIDSIHSFSNFKNCCNTNIMSSAFDVFDAFSYAAFYPFWFFSYHFKICWTFFLSRILSTFISSIINRCTFVISVILIAASFNTWQRNRFKSLILPSSIHSLMQFLFYTALLNNCIKWHLNWYRNNALLRHSAGIYEKLIFRSKKNEMMKKTNNNIECTCWIVIEK